MALSLVIAAAGAAGVGLWSHNTMIAQAEAVDAAWAQVESNLQRRADLVPRLVEVARRAMSHESQVLEAVVRQRTAPAVAMRDALEQLDRAQAASRAQIASIGGAAPAEETSLAALVRHDAEVRRGVQVVLAVAESYPSLRSSDQLLELQAQLEGSENRINAARMGFNDAVRHYNAAIAQLPTRWIAQGRGLERRPYFEATEQAHSAATLGLD
jgi:LemA protein